MSTAGIIHSHDFESAIVKVQLDNSSAMTGKDLASIPALELSGQPEPLFSDNDLSFAERDFERQRRNSSIGERTHVELCVFYLRLMSANIPSRKLFMF